MEELLKMKAEVVEMRLPYPEKGDRLVRVYLPERGEGETFPVIYMTDGQNLFDEEHASWGCWHTREAVEQERLNSGRAAVIVGIHNDNEWRDNELTPAGIGEVSTELGMDNFTAPEGEIFDGFVIDTIMPAVEARFPVKRGRRNTAFCGSSSGGLQSFFTALSHPDLFGMAGVFSPAFPLYSGEDMHRWIAARLCEELPYLYFYTGAGDELEQRIFQSTEDVCDFMAACYPYELLNEVILLENKHHESAWEPIFRDFLHTFLFRAAC